MTTNETGREFLRSLLALTTERADIYPLVIGYDHLIEMEVPENVLNSHRETMYDYLVHLGDQLYRESDIPEDQKDAFFNDSVNRRLESLNIDHLADLINTPDEAELVGAILAYLSMDSEVRHTRSFDEAAEMITWYATAY